MNSPSSHVRFIPRTEVGYKTRTHYEKHQTVIDRLAAAFALTGCGDSSKDTPEPEGDGQRRRQLASGFVEFAPVRRRLPLVQRVRFVRHLPAALQARIRPPGRHVFLRQTHAQRPVQRQHPVGKRLIPGFVQRRRNTDDADQHFEHERRLGLRQGRNPVGDHLRRGWSPHPKAGPKICRGSSEPPSCRHAPQPFIGLRRFVSRAKASPRTGLFRTPACNLPEQ